jgi:hypothetical protein
MANGLLGGLNAFLENKRRVAKRQLSDLASSPADFAAMTAPRWREGFEEQLGRPESGADFMTPGPLGALAGVIKAKGGNWLGRSVEDAIDPLLERLGEVRPERLAQLQAINPAIRNDGTGQALYNWIEGPLSKYIKRDMATPGDPVRALAEQDILHVAPDQLNFNERMMGRHLGRDEDDIWKYMGQSNTAKMWEGVTDNSIFAHKAGPLQGEPAALEINPWLSKVDPESQVHSIADRQNLGEDLGFNHLVDELRNALIPDSGLPQNLLLRPEQMQQMGMEKAVRHVDAINKWRANQQVEMNKGLADKAQVIREYTENNPKGLKWTELKGKSSDEHRAITEDQIRKDFPGLEQTNPTKFNEFVKDEMHATRISVNEELEKQLKYEGDQMGHCVGGYCPDVVEGRSRIFSLRDAKGQPHVTVEVDPNLIDMSDFTGGFVRGKMNQDEAIKAIKELNTSGKMMGDISDWVKPIIKDGLGIPKVQQIKGKGNAKPKDDYLPFVQDFVKNNPLGAKWSDVRDLSNTGLRRGPDGQFIPE